MTLDKETPAAGARRIYRGGSLQQFLPWQTDRRRLSASFVRDPRTTSERGVDFSIDIRFTRHYRGT